MSDNTLRAVPLGELPAVPVRAAWQLSRAYRSHAAEVDLSFPSAAKYYKSFWRALFRLARARRWFDLRVYALMADDKVSGLLTLQQKGFVLSNQHGDSIRLHGPNFAFWMGKSSGKKRLGQIMTLVSAQLVELRKVFNGTPWTVVRDDHPRMHEALQPFLEDGLLRHQGNGYDASVVVGHPDPVTAYQFRRSLNGLAVSQSVQYS